MKPQPTNTLETLEPTKNHQILLSSRPSGEPSQDNFQLAETGIPRPGPGQMLLRTIYLSLNPYMRGRSCGSELTGTHGTRNSRSTDHRSASLYCEGELQRRELGRADTTAKSSLNRLYLAYTARNIRMPRNRAVRDTLLKAKAQW